MNVKITKVVVDIAGRELILTLDEAKELMRVLRESLRIPDTTAYHPIPPVEWTRTQATTPRTTWQPTNGTISISDSGTPNGVYISDGTIRYSS